MATRLTVSLLAFALCAAPTFSALAQPSSAPPLPQQYQGNAGVWDAPPADFRDDMTRRAFRDGITAARNDMDAHRKLDYHRNPLYKHPPVTGPHHDEYRNAFERGYDVALRHANVPGYNR